VKMEVDRMTYDVAHEVDSRTSTVLDMLRKVPMVSVDGQDNITVKALEDMLPEDRFMRVHRSYIVALDRIDSVSAGGDISIGGVFIHVSDSYRSTFDAWLDSHSLIFIDR